jgi:hypothetical protein
MRWAAYNPRFPGPSESRNAEETLFVVRLALQSHRPQKRRARYKVSTRDASTSGQNLQLLRELAVDTVRGAQAVQVAFASSTNTDDSLHRCNALERRTQRPEHERQVDD